MILAHIVTGAVSGYLQAFPSLYLLTKLSLTFGAGNSHPARIMADSGWAQSSSPSRVRNLHAHAFHDFKDGAIFGPKVIAHATCGLLFQLIILVQGHKRDRC